MFVSTEGMFVVSLVQQTILSVIICMLLCSMSGTVESLYHVYSRVKDLIFKVICGNRSSVIL